MYAADPDPWQFRTRWYEQRKYAATLAALPRARYRTGFEPGCSIGVLTAQLARRCDRLLAFDPVASAVSAARSAVADLPGVRVDQGALPEDWPDTALDLIVLSEVGYYLDRPALDATLARAVAALQDGGDLVAVHWRHPVADYPLTGDEVHAALRALPGLSRVLAHEETDFWLEVFRCGAPDSVARREGLC
jgi:trans-aconitate methyltransferase